MAISLFVFSGTHNIFSTSFSSVLQIDYIKTICCSNLYCLPQLSSFNFTMPEGEFISGCTQTQMCELQKTQ